MRALAASLLWLLLLAAFPAPGSDATWPAGEQVRSELQAPAALLRTHELLQALPRLPEAAGKGPGDPDPVVLLLASLLAAGTVLLLWRHPHQSSSSVRATRQRRPAAPRAPPAVLP